MISLLLPLRLVSVANQREHWSKKARRVKAERAAVTMFLGARPRPPFPVLITLTRIAPRKLDSHDNVRMAFKAVVDSIAAWFGVPDNDPRIEWAYDQRSGKAREYAVEIRIAPLSRATGAGR